MTHGSPRIGLALGSGAARGWSHIGVIRTLQDAGVTPDIVCGTSVGALVGATCAAGTIDHLDTWVRGLTWQSVLGLLDFRMGGGLIEGGKLVDFLRSHFDDKDIESLPARFGCVATELASGREIWLREGPVVTAVRASIALPGLFTPAMIDGRLLVDGGLVNPVPVSLCRAMGADIVIAVDLNWDLIERRHRIAVEPDAESSMPGSELFSAILSKFSPRGSGEAPDDMPSMLDVLTTSLNIMQVRITQSRLAGEPADVVIRPRLSGIAAMDFHRGAATIEEGARATERMLPTIRELITH
jgi:NTE family protein